MPNSIWDTRFTRAKPPMALDAAVVDALFALDDWITIRGAHVEIDGDGNVLHGAGGKFNGTNYYRHMNEKVRAERGSLALNFNSKEYEKDLKKIVKEEMKAAEKEAEEDRESEFRNNEWRVTSKLGELNKAYAKYKTPKGYGKYEEAYERAKEEQDRHRSPQELQQMADQFYMLGETDKGARYDDYAKAAGEDLENRTRDNLERRIKDNDDFKDKYDDDFGKYDDDVKSEIGYEGSREDAINKFIKENSDRLTKRSEERAIYERADARAKDLLDNMRKNGGIPEGVERYGDEDGNVRDENGQIVENSDQVLHGIHTTEQRDASGQKSIFGGSGWW